MTLCGEKRFLEWTHQFYLWGFCVVFINAFTGLKYWFVLGEVCLRRYFLPYLFSTGMPPKVFYAIPIFCRYASEGIFCHTYFLQVCLLKYFLPYLFSVGMPPKVFFAIPIFCRYASESIFCHTYFLQVCFRTYFLVLVLGKIYFAITLQQSVGVTDKSPRHLCYSWGDFFSHPVNKIWIIPGFPQPSLCKPCALHTPQQVPTI